MTEQERWAVYLDSLDSKVASKMITAEQADRIRTIWAKGSAFEPNLRYPTAGGDLDGHYHLAWSYIGLNRTVEVEIWRDGGMVWFFKDDVTGAIEGNDDDCKVSELPPLFFTLLRLFQRATT